MQANKRQRYCEPRTLAQLTFGSDFSAVLLNDNLARI